MARIERSSVDGELDRVRPTVAALREIAFDLHHMNHPLTAEKVRKAADQLRDVAIEIDRRVGRE